MRKSDLEILERCENGKVKLTPSEKARFWSYVEKQPGDGCWLWKGSFYPNGYGRFSFNGAGRRVHRLSYLIHKEFIPYEMNVCHKCDVKNCIRPSHLWKGTQQENMTDMVKKGRSLTGERHPFAGKPEKYHRGDAHWSRQRPDEVSRGVDHGMVKLTPKQILEIRALWKIRWGRQWQIAEKYGIGQPHVSSIVRRAVWAHLP